MMADGWFSESDYLDNFYSIERPSQVRRWTESVSGSAIIRSGEMRRCNISPQHSSKITIGLRLSIRQENTACLFCTLLVPLLYIFVVPFWPHAVRNRFG